MKSKIIAGCDWCAYYNRKNKFQSYFFISQKVYKYTNVHKNKVYLNFNVLIITIKMIYEEQIKSEEATISSLRNQIRQIRLPARTVNWQHNNSSSPRNAIQQRLLVKKQKSQINTKIKSSQSKIISLRSLIFGE